MPGDDGSSFRSTTSQPLLDGSSVFDESFRFSPGACVGCTGSVRGTCGVGGVIKIVFVPNGAGGIDDVVPAGGSDEVVFAGGLDDTTGAAGTLRIGAGGPVYAGGTDSISSSRAWSCE
jgi:hypothetical protein